MDWLNSEYSKSLFERIDMEPTDKVAGIAEDGGDIVVWFHNNEEVRYPGKALSLAN